MDECALARFKRHDGSQRKSKKFFLLTVALMTPKRQIGRVEIDRLNHDGTKFTGWVFGIFPVINEPALINGGW